MMNPLPRFILASGSPRRRELLASLNIPFKVIVSNIDETQRPDEAPLAYVERLSIEKAEAVASELEFPAIILAADTIVLFDNHILGKPVDAADAKRILSLLRGETHSVFTAITLLHIGERDRRIVPFNKFTALHQTPVTMRDYSDAEIDAYIKTGDPFDKAGSYAIQHTDFHPVERIEGCYNNVVGLPLCAVKRGLVTLGYPGINAAENCDCPKHL